MSIPTPQITITGTVVDVSGRPLSSGTVVFTLNNYGSSIPLIAGNVVLELVTISATITNGAFSATMYGNDVIVPINQTFYSVTIPNGAGTYVKNYQFTGSGTFDISSLSPLGATIPNAATPSQVAPQVFTAQPGKFLTGLTTTGAFNTALPSVYARLFANQGTSLTASNFTLSAGWGTTATVSSVLGGDAAFFFTVSSSGTGQSASPTVTIVFANGTWTNTPVAICLPVQGSASSMSGLFQTSASSATQLVIGASGFTPSAGQTYSLNVICIGK